MAITIPASTRRLITVLAAVVAVVTLVACGTASTSAPRAVELQFTGVTNQPAFAFVAADGHVDVVKADLSETELARRVTALTGE